MHTFAASDSVMIIIFLLFAICTVPAMRPLHRIASILLARNKQSREICIDVRWFPRAKTYTEFNWIELNWNNSPPTYFLYMNHGHWMNPNDSATQWQTLPQNSCNAIALDRNDVFFYVRRSSPVYYSIDRYLSYQGSDYYFDTSSKNVLFY